MRKDFNTCVISVLRNDRQCTYMFSHQRVKIFKFQVFCTSIFVKYELNANCHSHLNFIERTPEGEPLRDLIDVIIVLDHGMASAGTDDVVLLHQYVNHTTLEMYMCRASTAVCYLWPKHDQLDLVSKESFWILLKVNDMLLIKYQRIYMLCGCQRW